MISGSSRLKAGVTAAVLLLAQTAHAGPWGPWSTSSDAPAILSRADSETAPREQPEQQPGSIAATPFLWLLAFYQKAIGPVTGGRCPMYPTCSQYSVQALRKHGPVIGIAMTADRLIHELDEQRFVPLSKVGSRYRFLDPVENNDFWWYRE
jgi:hypothetical protein